MMYVHVIRFIILISGCQHLIMYHTMIHTMYNYCIIYFTKLVSCYTKESAANNLSYRWCHRQQLMIREVCKYMERWEGDEEILEKCRIKMSGKVLHKKKYETEKYNLFPRHGILWRVGQSRNLINGYWKQYMWMDSQNLLMSRGCHHMRPPAPMNGLVLHMSWISDNINQSVVLLGM